MIFYKHPKIIGNLDLNINNNKIERFETFNFLGLHLNTHLTWNIMILVISYHEKNISNYKSLFVIYKMKPILPFYIVLYVYNTFILPHINYCLLSWGQKVFEQLCYKNVHYEQYFQVDSMHIQNLYLKHDIYKTRIFVFYHNLRHYNLPDYKL